ncbi:unnamed protein product [Parnassius apollo]|uniref:(apollo) hypothetical protein n=1 Tax=Parnassius apollo TaxID=110799 RepID=A0A8S3YBD0_PARAO|nr:unnamed protein product [Parnassius apollo]
MHQYKFVWFRNATILVRVQDGDTAFAIRTDDDLRKTKSRTKERDVGVRLELWLRPLRALGGAGGGEGGGAGGVADVAAAAMHDTRSLSHAYVDLLYQYGVMVRAGGLWEQLVLLLELVAAMNFPRTAFPPPHDAVLRRECERRLRSVEDKAIESGLPLHAVWVRVERARAAAHWRPAGGGEGEGDADEPAQADPQRAPLAHDVATLLQPVADAHQLWRLSVRMLMLAKVPLLGGAGWSARDELLEGGECGECGEELLPLLAEARLLPCVLAAHAPAALAQRLLALCLDPPHYFTDEDGQ